MLGAGIGIRVGASAAGTHCSRRLPLPAARWASRPAIRVHLCARAERRNACMAGANATGTQQRMDDWTLQKTDGSSGTQRNVTDKTQRKTTRQRLEFLQWENAGT